jgi:hypothetical protein
LTLGKVFWEKVEPATSVFCSFGTVPCPFAFGA